MTDKQPQTTKSLKEILPNYKWFWVWIEGKWEIGRQGSFAIFDTMDDEPDGVIFYGAPAIGIEEPKPPEKEDIYPCCGALKKMWHHYECKESDHDD